MGISNSTSVEYLVLTKQSKISKKTISRENKIDKTRVHTDAQYSRLSICSNLIPVLVISLYGLLIYVSVNFKWYIINVIRHIRPKLRAVPKRSNMLNKNTQVYSPFGSSCIIYRHGLIVQILLELRTIRDCTSPMAQKDLMRILDCDYGQIYLMIMNNVRQKMTRNSNDSIPLRMLMVTIQFFDMPNYS